MTPIQRGFVVVITTPAQSSETALEALLRSMLQRLPGPPSSAPTLWIDAEAGVAIGIPEAAETPAAITMLRSLPGEITFAASGMHGRLDGLRASGDSAPGAEIIAAAVAQLDPRQLALKNDDPLAFAIWNGRERTLSVSRDRVGHIPLFYGRAGQDLVVATHLNAFDGHPDFSGEIDRAGLASVLRNRVPPLPITIFRDVTQVLPGNLLTIGNGGGTIRVETSNYWSLRDTHRAALADVSDASPEEISNELQRRVAHSIDRSFTDSASPLGIFFSAGVDSNLIAAVATTTSHPVLTFTSRFDGNRIDEAPFATTMAALLGTKHQTLNMTPDLLLGAIEKSPNAYGQPHADQAGLPAIIMAEMAASQVPLIVTGDAGNDLFANNKNYDDYFRLLNLPEKVPGPLRKPLAAAARVGAGAVEQFERIVNRVAPNSPAAKIRSSGLHRISSTLAADNLETQMRIHSSHNVTPQRYLVGHVREFTGAYSDPSVWLDAGDRYDRWRFIELRNIGIGIESGKHEGSLTAAGVGYRGTMLDPAMIEFALRVPESVRGKEGLNRWPNIDVVRRIAPTGAPVPIETGFGVPTDKWLRKELRPWAESLLSESNLRATGLFDVDAVRIEWRQHLSGHHDRHYVLWPILMTLNWLDARKHRSS
ncbi:asparagine synthase (glutamine-hydrolyzing) [soil metagenome]